MMNLPLKVISIHYNFETIVDDQSDIDVTESSTVSGTCILIQVLKDERSLL